VSKTMGEKLLLGWTLLSDVCPNPECYQPLMRDREKQMWCLACNTRVIYKEDFDPTKHKLVSEASDKVPSSNSTPAPSSSTPFKAVSNNNSSGAISSDKSAKPLDAIPFSSHENNAPTPTSPAATSPAKAGSSSTTAGVPFQFPTGNISLSSSNSLNNFGSPFLPNSGSNSGSNSGDRELSQAMRRKEQGEYSLSILHIKLYDMSMKLAQETHPKAIGQLCAAIKECGLAIKALSK